MAGHVGRKAAFVTDGDAHALVDQELLERMKHLGAVTHSFAKAGCAHRNNHEFLDVQVVVGMSAPIDDVHHGHRHLHGTAAAEITVQRQASLFSGGACHGHADSQHGVRAQPRFVLGAVKVNQRAVQKSLLTRVQTQHSFGDFGVDMFDGLEHAFAQVA